MNGIRKTTRLDTHIYSSQRHAIGPGHRGDATPGRVRVLGEGEARCMLSTRVLDEGPVGVSGIGLLRRTPSVVRSLANDGVASLGVDNAARRAPYVECVGESGAYIARPRFEGVRQALWGVYASSPVGVGSHSALV